MRVLLAILGLWPKRVAGAVLVLAALLSGPAARAQDPLGGLTLGAFLNNALDQVNQAILNARNAGNAVAIEAGRQASLTIQQAENAYADQLQNTAGHLDKVVLMTAGQLKGLSDDILAHADMTLETVTKRAQQIANTLPFAGKEPQVTSVKPRYVVPKDVASNDLEITFDGNFPGSAAEGFAPYLKAGGQVFQVHNTTPSLTFLVPQSALFSSTAENATRAQYAEATLIIPWAADRFFGLVNVRREDHYNILIGSLPSSPGQITAIHALTAMKPVTKDFCSGNFHQCSTSECGNNDDLNHEWPTTPDNGWHVVRNTSSPRISSVQGDVKLPSFVSDGGDRVSYVASTIHHRFGPSGSLDFSICFKETEDQPIKDTETQAVALKWGDSKSLDMAPGSYQVIFTDFTGKHVEFRAPDNSNPFIVVSEPGGKLLIKTKDPDNINWP